MTSSAETAYETLKATEGQDLGRGEWFEVTQERIDDFADATLDHQWIHVDVDRAKELTPFGGTIAHGFLTLSLMVHLTTTLPEQLPRPEGAIMGINYGLNRARFINPVPAGARVRAHGKIDSIELKGNAIDMTRTITVEIEGADKPAMVAEWVSRIVFA